MASAKRPPINRPSPEHKLTTMQAKRLASLAGVEASELEGLSYAQASDRLRWIDPQLFWFRELCGKVVKKDPVTGAEYPIPFATVNVQETECDLISYFPEGSPWAWHLPIFCRRETIGTVQTDACGNFCVWVPRFEIEWILRWRELRLCFPIIFNRPSLIDLIPQPIPIKVPGHPDLGPAALADELAGLDPAGDRRQTGRQLAGRESQPGCRPPRPSARAEHTVGRSACTGGCSTPSCRRRCRPSSAMPSPARAGSSPLKALPAPTASAPRWR